MTLVFSPSCKQSSQPAAAARDYLSYSAISTYQQCPLKYYFRYVEGLPEETVSASLVFGGAIHAAVDRHFRSLLETGLAPTIEQLMQAYKEEWVQRSSRQVAFAKDETPSSLDQLAVRMLSAFQTSDLARPAGTVIGIEEELRVPLIPGVPDLLGRIDLLVDTGDALVITDFKTSRSQWTSEQADYAADQLVIYGELVRQRIGKKRLQLQFGVITKSKQPSVAVVKVASPANQASRTKRALEQVWRAIDGGHFYPSPSAVNCGGCPFRRPCKAWPQRIAA